VLRHCGEQRGYVCLTEQLAISVESVEWPFGDQILQRVSADAQLCCGFVHGVDAPERSCPTHLLRPRFRYRVTLAPRLREYVLYLAAGGGEQICG
jgi:hypothetical protein